MADYKGTGRDDFAVFSSNIAVRVDFVYQTDQVGSGVVVDFPLTLDLPLTASPYLLAKKVRGR